MTTRNIRDIKPSKRINTRNASASRSGRPRRVKTPSKVTSNGPGSGVWIIALLTIVGFFFVLSSALSSATVTIDPRTEDVPLSEVFSVGRESDNPNAARFEMIKIDGEYTAQAKNVVTSEIEQRARGTVVLYNTNTSSQPLLIDTRLRGSNDLVYKTVEAVRIPGASGDTPGSLEVEIYADQSGPEYNLQNSDFTVVGFEGTSKETQVYARSKTSISGGTDGLTYLVDLDAREAFVANMRKQLRENLYQKALQEIPEGNISFADVSVLNANIPDSALQSKEQTFDVTISGSLFVYIFPEDVFEQTILGLSEDLFMPESAHIANLETLNLRLTTADIVAANPASINSLSLSLQDTVKVFWKTDIVSLEQDLLGVRRTGFEQAINEYETISVADIVIRPFWTNKIPEKESRLTITEQLPTGDVDL